MRKRMLLAIGVLTIVVLASAEPGGGVAGFGDVGDERYYTDAVQWMVDNEITTGTSATCFSPEDAITRGQAAAFLWRMEGRPEAAPHRFGDVNSAYQQAPVSWLSATGVTTGTTASSFEPDRVLNRGEAAALIWRLAGSPAASSFHPFGDVVRPWQEGAISWLHARGITTGVSASEFAPDDAVTRAQMATFLYRYKGEPTAVANSDHPVFPWCEQQVPRPIPEASSSCVLSEGAVAPALECRLGLDEIEPAVFTCTATVDSESFLFPEVAYDCSGDVDDDPDVETWSCTQTRGLDDDSGHCVGDVQGTEGDETWGCTWQYNADFDPDYPNDGIVVGCSGPVDAPLGTALPARIDCLASGGQIDCTGDLGSDGSEEQWTCVVATVSCGNDARATLQMLPAHIALVRLEA